MLARCIRQLQTEMAGAYKDEGAQVGVPGRALWPLQLLCLLCLLCPLCLSVVPTLLGGSCLSQGLAQWGPA